jgi:hypothetical protein
LTSSILTPISTGGLIANEDSHDTIAHLASKENTALISSIQEKPPMKQKTVVYKGGIITFSIPNAWLEEYPPTGGATFYEDREDSGTFRLNVLKFQSDGPSEQMIQDLIRKQGYKQLREDLAIRSETKSILEDSEMLEIYTWNVAIPVPPSSIRLAVFSYTVLKTQSTERSVQQEIEFLANSIFDADYSNAPGVSGD